MEVIVVCEDRTLRHTNGCGGAFYWWCHRDNKQINIYENCPKCNEVTHDKCQFIRDTGQGKFCGYGYENIEDHNIYGDLRCESCIITEEDSDEL